MLTTLYCDASFCPHQLVGGWAIWLRSNQGRIIEHGATPDYCDFSNEAELAAIYAGIYRGLTRWPQTTAILVRSDCRDALNLMENRHEAPTQSGRRLAKKIHDLQAQRGVRLIPRWVKGHQRGTEVDAYLNNRVDELARTMMRRERRRDRREQREQG